MKQITVYRVITFLTCLTLGLIFAAAWIGANN